MEIIKPVVRGINVELDDFNLFLTVKDNYNQLVKNAKVTINDGEYSHSTYTNDRGLFKGLVDPGKEFTVSIRKNGFNILLQRLMLIKRSILPDLDNNFYFFLKSTEGIPIDNAKITVIDNVNFTSYSPGQTDVNGFFSTKLDFLTEKTIFIYKPNYANLNYTVPAFNDSEVSSGQYIAVPVIYVE